MSKEEVKIICPEATCKQDKNGRYYISDGISTPVFPSGHASSRKAWADYLKVLETSEITERSQFGV